MVFGKKKTDTGISAERFSRSIPMINPAIKYEEDGSGIVTILRPAERSRWFGQIGEDASQEATTKTKLDEIGSKVWKRIDGKARVDELVEWMKKEFVITQREAEMSLSLFLKRLQEKKLVAMLVPLPKPFTQEALVEIERLKDEIKELEKAYAKKKLDEATYRSLLEKYQDDINTLQSPETSKEGTQG